MSGEQWSVFYNGALTKVHDGNIGLHDSGALLLMDGRETVAVIAGGKWSSAVRSTVDDFEEES